MTDSKEDVLVEKKYEQANTRPKEIYAEENAKIVGYWDIVSTVRLMKFYEMTNFYLRLEVKLLGNARLRSKLAS